MALGDGAVVESIGMNDGKQVVGVPAGGGNLFEQAMTEDGAGCSWHNDLPGLDATEYRYR
jgi:hypothetical protein